MPSSKSNIRRNEESTNVVHTTASDSSSEKKSTICDLSKQAEIVKNSLLQNIRIVNSSNSKFTDSYVGISSLLNSFKKHKDTYDGGEGKTGLTFNEELLKFSIKKYRDIYSLNEFSSFFHRTVDSEPVPLIYDPNLDFEIFDKEAEIYKNNYISVKSKSNLNTNEKFILTFTRRKLTIVKNSLGFSITKQIGTNDIYKINVGEIFEVYRCPTISDGRKFVKSDPGYKKCMEAIRDTKNELSEKITEYNELVKKLKKELDEIKDTGPNSIDKYKQKIEHIKQQSEDDIKKAKSSTASKESANATIVSIEKIRISEISKIMVGLKEQVEIFNKKVQEDNPKIKESNDAIEALKKNIKEKKKNVMITMVKTNQQKKKEMIQHYQIFAMLLL